MMPAIVVSLGLFGAALAGVGYVPWKMAVMALLVICGFSMVTCLALCNTSIQQRVPDHMRGRVLSMYTFSSYAFLPIGNLAGGALAEHRGIGLTRMLLGAVLLAAAIAAATTIRQRADRMVGYRVAVND